ncbi:MAG: hypothetical protein K0R72_715 [Clostridia bacterium]|jgi:hypothetical protein|nr:hypothetical protein [Clostridia bacterium]
MDINYSLLENGLDFLISSINNINYSKECDESLRKRYLKYSVLNLSSGIELVFKYKLVNEHWTYIFADMNKANKRELEEGDIKSVDSISNIERLKRFCNVCFSTEDERILENLRKRRNKMEHFKIKESIEAVETIMYDSLSLVIKFIAEYINITNISDDEKELLFSIQKETQNLKEIINAREKIIEATAKQDGVFDELVTCPNCFKKFLSIDCGNNECLFCYYTDDSHNIADLYISNVLGISSYECIKDGGIYPLCNCTECGENSMVLDYNENIAFCFYCKFKTKLEDIRLCCNCGQPFNSIDNDIMICEECLNYEISKDD